MHIERFIDLVKERPVLYDSQHPQYSDKKEKRKMWREISMSMSLTGNVTRKKWRNLKDCYVKYLKSKYTARGRSASRYMNWQWAEHMEFMKQHVKFTVPVSKFEQQSNSEGDDVESQTDSDILDTKFNPLEISHEETPTHQSNTPKSGVLPNVSSNKTRYHRYNEEKRNISYYDATELIFLGFARTIKNFSIERQAEIKTKIAKIMMEEEIAHSEETLFQNTSILDANSESSTS